MENLEINRYDKFKLVYTHSGLSVKELIKLTNVHSINHFAEQLLMLLSYQKNGIGSIKESIKILEKFANVRFETINKLNGELQIIENQIKFKCIKTKS